MTMGGHPIIPGTQAGHILGMEVMDGTAPGVGTHPGIMVTITGDGVIILGTTAAGIVLIGVGVLTTWHGMFGDGTTILSPIATVLPDMWTPAHAPAVIVLVWQPIATLVAV